MAQQPTTTVTLGQFLQLPQRVLQYSITTLHGLPALLIGTNTHLIRLCIFENKSLIQGALEETKQRLKPTSLTEGTVKLSAPWLLIGTPFQHRVWHQLALQKPNTTLTYQELAQKCGAPRAARAVANAVGANPLALLIPCHLVVRSDGGLGGYRWGLTVKKKLLRACVHTSE